ncbi:hypothetical protein D3C73_1336080 [compost metagenome]
MLATSKKDNNNGISINGFSLSGLSTAPLVDEAQRIAAFYGLPLSSRADNAGGTRATGIFSVIKEEIASSQQLGVANVTEPPVQPQSQSTVTSAAIQPAMPVVTPMQDGAIPAQPASPESASTSQQLPR